MSPRFAVSLIAACLLGMAPQDPTEAEAQRLGREGVDLLESGNPGAAVERLQRSLVIWKALKSDQGEAALTGKLAEAERARGNAVAALRLHLSAGRSWAGLRESSAALRQFTMAAELANITKSGSGICES